MNLSSGGSNVLWQSATRDGASGVRVAVGACVVALVVVAVVGGIVGRQQEAGSVERLVALLPAGFAESCEASHHLVVPDGVLKEPGVKCAVADRHGAAAYDSLDIQLYEAADAALAERWARGMQPGEDCGSGPTPAMDDIGPHTCYEHPAGSDTFILVKWFDTDRGYYGELTGRCVRCPSDRLEQLDDLRQVVAASVHAYVDVDDG